MTRANTRRRTWARPLLAALAACAAAVSCGSEEPGASLTSEKLGTPMLDLIEFDGSFADIQFSDISMAAERKGLAAPPAGQPVRPFASELMADGASVSYGTWSIFADEPELWGPVVGVEPSQIAESMKYFTGPFGMDLFRPIDPITLDDLEESVRQDPVWAPQLVRVETPAGDYFDWNVEDDSKVDLELSDGVRPLGLAGQVGVAGETVVWSGSHHFVEQALAANAGEVVRLADADLVVELLADYDGPQPQAFTMILDPAIETISMLMNVPGSTGYDAVLLVIDPSIEGTPGLSSSAGAAVVERVNSVVEVRLEGNGSYEVLQYCLFVETCFIDG